MIGIFTKSLEKAKKEELYFVSVPDALPPEEIKERFSQLAQSFANKTDSNKVYLIYGKDNTITYEYTD